MIPASVTYVGHSAFLSCNEDITVIRYGSDEGWDEKWDYIGRDRSSWREVLNYANVVDRSVEYGCYVRGKAYYSGNKQDRKQAYPLLKRAAEGGIEEAYVWLGVCYQDGVGVTKNLEQAVFWLGKYKEAKGESCPLFVERTLADAYCDMNTDQGYRRAIDLYQSLLSRCGDEYESRGNVYLRLAYCYRNKSNADCESALRYYEMAADAGVEACCFTVGKMYEEGEGTAPSAEKALYWYEKALADLTDDENAEGLCYRAVSLYLNQKTAQGEKRAFELLLRLAKHGDSVATYWVGEMYANGRGTEKSLIEAEKWLLEAANAEVEEAFRTLAAIYLDAKGLLYNAEKAVHWLEIMAKNGDLEAKLLLKKMREQGIGVVKNEAEAKENYALYQSYKYGWNGYELNWQKADEYLLKAAEAGLPDAQYDLALQYFKRRDLDRAEALWQQAAARGHGKSRTQLEQLRHKREKEEAREREARLADAALAQSVKNAAPIEQGSPTEQGASAVSAPEIPVFVAEVEESVPVTAASEAFESVAEAAESTCVTGEELEEPTAPVRTAEEIQEERYEHAFRMYYGIDGVAYDRTTAVSELSVLADEGHAAASVMIGSCYVVGTCVEKDGARAFRYFSKAAEKGDANALYYLSNCYRYGSGVAVDKEKSERLLKEAVDKDVPDAITTIAQRYRMGWDGCRRDALEAKRWLERLRPKAEAGDIVSQYMIGSGYGLLVQRVDNAERASCGEQAIYWLQRAASRGYPSALFMLAEGYADGKHGAAVDLAKAKECFEKAAVRGHVIAGERLADIYYFGKGCARDLEKAAALYCQGSSAHAKCMSAVLYFEGKGGLPKDTQKAVALFREVLTNKWISLDDKKLANEYLAKPRF